MSTATIYHWPLVIPRLFPLFTSMEGRLACLCFLGVFLCLAVSSASAAAAGQAAGGEPELLEAVALQTAGPLSGQGAAARATGLVRALNVDLAALQRRRKHRRLQAGLSGLSVQSGFGKLPIKDSINRIDGLGRNGGPRDFTKCDESGDLGGRRIQDTLDLMLCCQHAGSTCCKVCKCEWTAYWASISKCFPSDLDFAKRSGGLNDAGPEDEEATPALELTGPLSRPTRGDTTAQSKCLERPCKQPYASSLEWWTKMNRDDCPEHWAFNGGALAEYRMNRGQESVDPETGRLYLDICDDAGSLCPSAGLAVAVAAAAVALFQSSF